MLSANFVVALVRVTCSRGLKAGKKMVSEYF